MEILMRCLITSQPKSLQPIPPENIRVAPRSSEDNRTNQCFPQQLPGPEQVGDGPADPQHLAESVSGKPGFELTEACAESSFFIFLLPQLLHATRSSSVLAINISVVW